jgi:hypothetical protein
LHSAKALPSVALDKEHSTKNPSTKVSLPSATYRALGNKKKTRRQLLFDECHVSGTRQRIFSFLKKIFAECHGLVLGKEVF